MPSQQEQRFTDFLAQTYPVECLSLASLRIPGVKEVHPPLNSLYFQGNRALLEHLPDRGFSVVGTRQPDPRIHYFIDETFSQLKNAGLVILSGLARGVDQWAHEFALKNEIPTIGVLGCGHLYPYPKETLILRQKILEAGGLILSEWQPSTGVLPYQFLSRNRILAFLSKAVWIVQASNPSGALNTARWAIDLNRDVYATPSFPGDIRMSGNLGLLEKSEAQIFFNSFCLKSTWSNLWINAHSIKTSEDPRTNAPVFQTSRSRYE